MSKVHVPKLESRGSKSPNLRFQMSKVDISKIQREGSKARSLSRLQMFTMSKAEVSKARSKAKVQR